MSTKETNSTVRKMTEEEKAKMDKWAAKAREDREYNIAMAIHNRNKLRMREG